MIHARGNSVTTQSRQRRRGEQADLFEHSAQRIWEARYYDFNVCTARKRVETCIANAGPTSAGLRWQGWKPVKRGLVEAPELWHWSSFRAHAYQEAGLVRVNDWSVQELKLRKPTTFPQS